MIPLRSSLGIALFVGLAGCSGVPHRATTPKTVSVASTRAPVSSTGTTSVVLTFDAPWVNRRYRPYVPVAPDPTTLPPTGAPLCGTNDLSIAPNDGNGASQMSWSWFAFTNVSSTTCELGGYPLRVVAMVPGHAPIVATNGIYPPDAVVPGDIAPGRTATFTLQTTSFCLSNSPRPTPISGSAVMTLPAGGQIALPGTLDVTCGLEAGKLGLPLPQPTYPIEWYAGLKAQLTVPTTVDAGASFMFVVTLTNPTTHLARIDSCPSYFIIADDGREQIASGYGLNCDVVHSIAPHARVRYEMKLTVPRAAPSGTMSISWSMVGPGSPSAHMTTQVRGA